MSRIQRPPSERVRGGQVRSPGAPTRRVDRSWRIEIRPKWYGVTARVTGRGWLVMDRGPCFRRRTREAAIAAATAWCDESDAERLREERVERISYQHDKVERIGYTP